MFPLEPVTRLQTFSARKSQHCWLTVNASSDVHSIKLNHILNRTVKQREGFGTTVEKWLRIISYILSLVTWHHSSWGVTVVTPSELQKYSISFQLECHRNTFKMWNSCCLFDCTNRCKKERKKRNRGYPFSDYPKLKKQMDHCHFRNSWNLDNQMWICSCCFMSCMLKYWVKSYPRLYIVLVNRQSNIFCLTVKFLSEFIKKNILHC